MVRFFLWVFFGIKEIFGRLPLSFPLKPLLGGLLTGLIGLLTPMAIGNGYGWLQLLMDGKIE